MPIQYALKCPVCQEGLEVRLAKGRRSGKTFLMVICPVDGRHFRGFIADQKYLRQVMARVAGQGPASDGGGDDANITPTTVRRSNPALSEVEGNALERGGTP